MIAVGQYTPRVYFMALAFAVTIGGNLTLVGSTPCIATMNLANETAHKDCRALKDSYLNR